MIQRKQHVPDDVLRDACDYLKTRPEDAEYVVESYGRPYCGEGRIGGWTRRAAGRSWAAKAFHEECESAVLGLAETVRGFRMCKATAVSPHVVQCYRAGDPSPCPTFVWGVDEHAARERQEVGFTTDETYRALDAARREKARRRAEAEEPERRRASGEFG
jgi:hypothetical protein